MLVSIIIMVTYIISTLNHVLQELTRKSISKASTNIENILIKAEIWTKVN